MEVSYEVVVKREKGEKGESSSYIDSVNDCAAGLVRVFESRWTQSRSGTGGDDNWFGCLNPVGLSRDLAKGQGGLVCC